MSKTKHTPGPWKLNPQPNPNRPAYYTIYVKPGGPETVDHICQVTNKMSEKWKANARLIAAAPKLLAALEALQDAIREHGLLDIKKRFSLCTADAQANAAIILAENG